VGKKIRCARETTCDGQFCGSISATAAAVLVRFRARTRARVRCLWRRATTVQIGWQTLLEVNYSLARMWEDSTLKCHNSSHLPVRCPAENAVVEKCSSCQVVLLWCFQAFLLPDLKRKQAQITDPPVFRSNLLSDLPQVTTPTTAPALQHLYPKSIPAAIHPTFVAPTLEGRLRELLPPRQPTSCATNSLATSRHQRDRRIPRR
jgi:hypothetical protein